MNKDYIINYKGKEFVLYAGLLDDAHKKGLKRITTRVLQFPTEENGNLAVAWAEVELDTGIFSEVGDASPANVTPLIKPHIVRMALTRAKARALRDALNIGATAFEEILAEEDIPKRSTPKTNSVKNETTQKSPYQVLFQTALEVAEKKKVEVPVLVEQLRNKFSFSGNIADLSPDKQKEIQEYLSSQ